MSAVRVDSELSESFFTVTGVMKECVLSPVLFNILLEVVIALALEGNEIGATISGNLISNLCFADGICLVATSNDDLQQLVDAVHISVLIADSGRPQLRSSHASVLTVPRTNSRLGDRSFSVAGARIWNSLPASLRQSDIEFGQFKRLLVHSQVTIIFVVSVCLFVCLFVCLCRVFLSRL